MLKPSTLVLALGAVAALAACKPRPDRSALRGDLPSALPFTTKPLYVLIGGRSSCGLLTAHPFGDQYFTPFNGLRLGDAFKAFASGSERAAHPTTLVSDFRNELMTTAEHARWWRNGVTSDHFVFACHTGHVDGDQQFVWWSEAGARPPSEWEGLGATKQAARYAGMGYRRFVVQRPPADPYGGALAGFVDDVEAAAKRLNPDGGLRPLYVIGHSMGGYMAMRLVAALGARVDVMALQTLDPISPKGCPSSVWSGLLATQPAGCGRFPEDVDVAAVRAALDAGRKRGGGRIETTANWINYWQGPAAPGGGEAVVMDRDQNELPDAPDAGDAASYSKRLHSGPSPAGGADIDVRVVYRGVLIDGFKSHGWMASAGGIWRWKPRRVAHRGKRVLVDASRLAYVMRLHALVLTRGDAATEDWREPWDHPDAAGGGLGLTGEGAEEPWTALPPTVELVAGDLAPDGAEAPLPRP